jgi:anthranilate synthase component 1
MIRPSKAEFIEKAKKGNLIPVVKEILADYDTPVSVYLKMAAGPYSFLLESVEGNEKIGRYSFLGNSPKWIFQCKGKTVTFLQDGQVKTYEAEGNPLDELKKLMAVYRAVEDASLPRFFGGVVGYAGYGMVHAFENIPQEKRDDLNLPDACFLLADTLVAFDHVQHRIKIIANAFVENQDTGKAYEEAVQKIQTIEQELYSHKQPFIIEWEDTAQLENPAFKPNMSETAFVEMVDKSKEYIRAGDIFQVVLSQRFEIEQKCDPVTLYRALRTINPSPYMFLLKFNDFHLVGTSPEILVRCENNHVEVRPIAGTTPRGRSEEEDESLSKKLLEDPKERAEHLMLIDLGRNDIGRVCKYGTVRVTDLMVIEKYSHVMHIVSDVAGELSEGQDSFDVLKAAFPAGTVTGAPKIRAMQIIEELEPTHRSHYAGSIGYFSFSGDLDSCITIRTILLKNDKTYIQAGAGIVADSVPAKEYQETLNKAKAMMKAVAMVARIQNKSGNAHAAHH